PRQLDPPGGRASGPVPALTPSSPGIYHGGDRTTHDRNRGERRMAELYQSPFQRHKTREVQVGDVVIGGTNPIRVQSMTTTDTHDLEATVREIRHMEEAGCELVRVTVPKAEDASVLSEIKKRIKLPLICDIHFDYKMALAALDHPIDKIRINPGNVGGVERFRQVLRKCKDRGVSMRIGVNAGSLER